MSTPFNYYITRASLALNNDARVPGFRTLGAKMETLRNYTRPHDSEAVPSPSYTRNRNTSY